MSVSNTNNVNMQFTPPKVGVIPTPPKVSGTLNKNTIEIATAQTPKELKEAGVKKRKSPINFVNYLWLGVGAISSGVAIQELIKILKKH